MTRNIILAVALMAGTAVASSAQVPRPFKIGIAGGASAPVDKLGDAVNTGFNLNASVSYKPILFPLELQVEGAWNQWGLKSGVNNGNGNVHVLSLTGNAVYEFQSGTPVKPYALGSLGWYHITSDVNLSNNSTVSSSDDKMGIGGGVGIRMPLSGFDTYLEARYNHAFDTNLSFVPITFGIRF